MFRKKMCRWRKVWYNTDQMKLISEKGRFEMRTFPVAAALTAGVVTMTTIAGQTVFGNSCIIAGSTDRACASETWDESGTFALDTRIRMRRFGEPHAVFDSRFSATRFGDPLERFRSNEPTGAIIIVR